MPIAPRPVSDMVIYISNDADMNYVSAVYGVLMVVIGSDWVIRGRHCFRGQAARRGGS